MKTPPIFAKARNHPDLRLVAPSPADVAAAVRKPGALLLVQARLETLHARREVAQAEMRAIAASVHADPKDRRTLRLPLLERELKDLDQQIAVATDERNAARLPYTAQVAAALASMRRAAIENATAGLDQLIDGLTLIDACARQIEHAGGSAPRFPRLYRNAIAGLRERIQRLQ